MIYPITTMSFYSPKDNYNQKITKNNI